MDRNRQTLHRKLVIRFGLVYLISFLIVFGLFIYQYTQDFSRSISASEIQIKQALENKGLVLARNNGNALTGMIEDNAFISVRELVDKTIESDDDIIFGFYFDTGLNPWAESIEPSLQKEHEKALSLLIDWAIGQKQVSKQAFLLGTLEVITVAAPVFLDDEKVGVLIYGLSTEGIYRSMAEASEKAGESLSFTINLLLFFLFVSSVATYFIIGQISKKITIPLNLLTEAAEIISDGDYERMIKVKTDDEIGVLASSFNVMVRNINRQISDLAQINQLGSTLATARNEVVAMEFILQGISLQLHMESAIAFRNRGKSIVSQAFYHRNVQNFNFDAVSGWIEENLTKIETRSNSVNNHSLFRCNIGQIQGLKPFSYDVMYWLTLDVNQKHDVALAFFGYKQDIQVEQSELEFCLSVGQLLTTSLKNISMNELLEKQNRDLEATVKRRTIDLEVKNDALTNALDELENAQAQLIESEKMASLGSLVAGISHEVNTPLGISVTAASHLGEQAKSFERMFSEGKLTKSGFAQFLEVIKEGTDIILNNLDRAAELIKSFKQIAVDQSSDIETTFNVGEHLHMLVTSLKPSYKHQPITINLQIKDDINTLGFPGLLNQIITNLIMNSIKHGLEDCEAGLIDVIVTKQDGQFDIEVSDNGVGIPEENKSKIFDPFFTTKRGLGGSGLGLNIVYNIVKQKMNGDIHVEDVEPHGTRFVVSLPIVAREYS